MGKHLLWDSPCCTVQGGITKSLKALERNKEEVKISA
jgi:hypothetical protein